MTLAAILKEKNTNKEKLLLDNNLSNKKLPLWLIKLESKLIDNTLLEALKILPANFIVPINVDFEEKCNNISTTKNNVGNLWYDFIVCDECENDLMSYIKNWSVPIIWKSHHISNILTEFNAAKVEWNSFIFENDSLCDIYYAIIRYVENFKFPYDNKALVKNVLDI